MARFSDPDSNASDAGRLALIDQPPAPDDVRRTVEAIVASGLLGAGDRRANLLRYLVEKELKGAGSKLKAFSIAIDVLGRDASFDPSTDSIVRSEVGRLRDALRLYFAEMAGSEDVVIEIPKGTYRPAFSAKAVTDLPVPPPRYRRVALLGLCLVVLAFVMGAVYESARPDPPEPVPGRIPIANLPYDLVRIAVAPFAGSGNNPNADQLAFGVYSELSMGLSAYPWIAVVSPVGGIGTLGPTEVDYVLLGDMHWDSDTILTSARLVDIDDARVIWADTQALTTEPAPIKASVDQVTSQIAFKLGSTHGIAPELLKRENARGSPESFAAFICFLQLYFYMLEPTDAGHLALRSCLTQAVQEFPTFGDGWAALALIHIDEARFARNPRAGRNAWQDAEDAVAQALKYAPLRMPTLNVALIHSIEAPRQDRAAFERFSSLLLHLFPRHPYTLYNVGSRMAEFTGQWERGIALIDEAIELEPVPPSAFHVTNAYLAALRGTAEEALAAVAPLTASTSESQLILRYLAAARNGLAADMYDNRVLLAQQGLTQNSEIINHVLQRRYVDELKTTLIDQLETAFSMEAGQ